MMPFGQQSAHPITSRKLRRENKILLKISKYGNISVFLQVNKE